MWTLYGHDREKWFPLYPWGAGTRDSPVGLTCRICANVSVLMLQPFFGVCIFCLNILSLSISIFSFATTRPETKLAKGSHCWWMGQGSWFHQESQATLLERSDETTRVPQQHSGQGTTSRSPGHIEKEYIQYSLVTQIEDHIVQ